MTDVKLIRLSSGEDVVATVLSKDGNVTTLKDAIVAIPTSQGQIGFAPWSPIISKDNPNIDVSNDHIVYVAEADSSVLEQYNTMFGLVIAPKPQSIIV